MEGRLLHGGAAGGDGVLPAAEMKKNGAAGTGLGIGRGVVTNKEFEGMGGVGLTHEVIVLVGWERFVGGKDEVPVVEGGGGFLDPEISIGDLAVAPARNGAEVSIPIENVAEEEDPGGGFAVTFAFLGSGLGGVKATAPSEAAAAEVDGYRGILGEPGGGGGVASIELEGGMAGVPTIGNRQQKGA